MRNKLTARLEYDHVLYHPTIEEDEVSKFSFEIVTDSFIKLRKRVSDRKIKRYFKLLREYLIDADKNYGLIVKKEKNSKDVTIDIVSFNLDW